MSAVNYEEIRQRNIEEYGKGTRHLAYLSDLYETRTHFLYELLQNAEDALEERDNQTDAGYVEFRLCDNRLELRHNGKPFDERDVTGICGIGEGTKTGDYSQIGKFGIGFKSVYAYTLAPRIYSNDEHFEVRRFVEPHALPDHTAPTDLKSGETCIVLPFDTQPEIQGYRAYVPQQQAISEIGQALKHLGLRTLLFLRFIDEIRWSLPDGASGAFLRETRAVNDKPAARYVDVTDGNTTETWLLFRRNTEVTDTEGNALAVEVGFLVQAGRVVRAKNTELVVSFPTAKKTELGFLIQGPFKTTKPRDNIEDEIKAKENPQLLETAALLAADSLEYLRDLGLLSVESFTALPLQSSVFQNDGTRFFKPVYEAIRNVLKSKSLLPRHKGGFVAASEARLARGAQLADVFSPEQLGTLFGVDQCYWLDTAITADRMPELRDYLAGKRKQWSRNEWEQEPLVDGIEVEAKDIAAKLTASFFQVQDESWLVDFYKYLDKNFEPYRETPFVRLEDDGTHIISRKAFLPPRDPSGIDMAVFPLVKQSLAEKRDALEFLRDKAKLREPDAVDVVIQCLLPKYGPGGLRFDPTEYRHDLQRIVAACGGEGRHRMTQALRSSMFIACTPARSPELGEIVWKAPGDQAVFIGTPELAAWFADNDQDEAWFIHPAANQILDNRICDFEVARPVPLLGCDSTSRGKIRLQSHHGWHKQGIDGFNPDAQILGLIFVLQHWNQDRARYLWSVLLDIPHLIKGYIQQETNLNRLDAARRISTYSKLGKACVDIAWLPDATGVPCKPKELLLSDLYDGFETTSIRAKEVAERLDMKQPERERALEIVTAGDSVLKELIDLYQSGSDSDREKLKKMIPIAAPPQPAPAFKDGLKGLSRLQRGEPTHGSTSSAPVGNSDSYQKKRDDDVEDAVKVHLAFPHIVTFSPVRNQPSNSVERDFLYSEYQGRCQVTGHTFPKAHANSDGVAENYFEACALLSYSNAGYLNDAGNMLCVSADTMAKFKNASFEWVDDLEEVIERFKTRKSGDTATVDILLAGEKARITWSERHFMRLIALWNKA